MQNMIHTLKIYVEKNIGGKPWIVGVRQELFASIFLDVTTNHFFSPVC